jgi:uncharacterized RDD family membrane protein YckC
VNNPNYNPYAAPTETPAYDFAQQADPDHHVLATLGQRFAGNMIDSLVLVVPAVVAMIPLAAVEKSVDGGSDSGALVLMIALGLVVCVVVGLQWFMISTRGQSIGKRLVKTKIVRLDGSNPGFLYGVLLRGLVGHLPAAVPLVGSLYGLADTLCIFKEDRRTLRDMIAGTRVIQV